ncbi:DUF3995 domain-containing protein [Streptomyces sp. NPDC053560]|uniref:DUF3995 domain-containing protein n=1 Tax=Streptomyces sp. NPDC053560 TaxID=3365711 RepID=UPI0037CF5831
MRAATRTAGLWGHLACAWAVLFAGLHFYWALGGDRGLSVSAGQALATERPSWFVAAGLWGVGILCLAGGALGWLLTRPRLPRPVGPTVRWLGRSAAALLIIRAAAIELLLLTGSPRLDASVSADQRFWTLVSWNPWFALGGLLFGLAAWGSGRLRPSAGRGG